MRPDEAVELAAALGDRIDSYGVNGHSATLITSTSLDVTLIEAAVLLAATTRPEDELASLRIRRWLGWRAADRRRQEAAMAALPAESIAYLSVPAPDEPVRPGGLPPAAVRHIAWVWERSGETQSPEDVRHDVMVRSLIVAQVSAVGLRGSPSGYDRRPAKPWCWAWRDRPFLWLWEEQPMGSPEPMDPFPVVVPADATAEELAADRYGVAARWTAGEVLVLDAVEVGRIADATGERGGRRRPSVVPAAVVESVAPVTAIRSTVPAEVVDPDEVAMRAWLAPELPPVGTYARAVHDWLTS